MIICVHCGKAIPDKARFCPACGAVQADPAEQLQSAPAELPEDSPLKIPDFGEPPAPTVNLKKAPPQEEITAPADFFGDGPLKVPDFGEPPAPTVNLRKTPPREETAAPADFFDDSPLKVPDFGEPPAPAVNLRKAPPREEAAAPADFFDGSPLMIPDFGEPPVSAVRPGKTPLPADFPDDGPPMIPDFGEPSAAAKFSPPLEKAFVPAGAVREPAAPPAPPPVPERDPEPAAPSKDAAPPEKKPARSKPPKDAAPPKKRDLPPVPTKRKPAAEQKKPQAAPQKKPVRCGPPKPGERPPRNLSPASPGYVAPAGKKPRDLRDPAAPKKRLPPPRPDAGRPPEKAPPRKRLPEAGRPVRKAGPGTKKNKSGIATVLITLLVLAAMSAAGFFLLRDRLNVRTVEDELAAIPGIIREMDAIAAEFSLTGNPDADVERYDRTRQKIGEYLNGLSASRQIASWSFSVPDFTVRMGHGSFVYDFDLKIEGVTGTLDGGGDYEVIIANDNQKSLLLLPAGGSGTGSLKGEAFVKALQTISESNLGYQAPVTRERGEVTTDVLKNLAEYRVIMICTHGGFGTECGPFFASGIPNDAMDVEDYTAGRLLYGSGGTAMVTAKYFEDRYDDGALNDCLFYLADCGGAWDSRLTDVLLRKGANTAVAFTGTTYCTYHDAMITSIVSELIRPDPDTGDQNLTKDILQAVRFAKGQNGEADPSGSPWFNRVMEHYGRGASEISVAVADSGNPFRLVNHTGDGVISGSVLMASDAVTPIPMAKVTLTGADGYRCTFFTDSEGRYTYSPPPGDYIITVSMKRYLDLLFSTRVLPNHTTYLESFLLVREDTANPIGQVQGIVNSALNGKGIAGAKLAFYKDWNNIGGEPVLTVSAGRDGRYQTELPLGNYTALVSAEGYLDLTFNVVSIPKESSRDQNVSMNVDAREENFRVVLSWGQFPEDLDIHVEGPSSGNNFHVYYPSGSMTFADKGVQVCKLDVDDRNSYGPETITLLPQEAGRPYYFYVHRYTGTAKTLSESGATLRVYSGSRLLKTFRVPTNGGNSLYWNVFAIIDGKILEQNTMTADAPDVRYADDWLARNGRGTGGE